MKAVKIAGYLVLVFIAALLTALWWNTAANPWCLTYFPKIADHVIYSIVRPLLSGDIGDAAEQMDFLEIMVSSFILWTTVTFPLAAYLEQSRNGNNGQ